MEAGLYGLSWNSLDPVRPASAIELCSVLISQNRCEWNDMDEEKEHTIRVTTPPVGSSYGGKLYITGEA